MNKVIERCQVCGSGDLLPFFFAGYLPPVNTLTLCGQRPVEQQAYPAQLLHCAHCRLVQLGLEVDPKTVFPPEYAYTSGTTKLLRDNFAELSQEVLELKLARPQDMVVDIGSNDGTLLKAFKEKGFVVYGIEPTNAADLAGLAGIPTWKAYLSQQSVQHVVQANQGRRANIVTACNVFAHIPDPNTAVENVLKLLAPGGVFISESHYLPSLLARLQYDTVYHEHLRYYSLTSLANLFMRHGLTVIHAKTISTHGGSMRVYAMRDSEVPTGFTRNVSLFQEEDGHDNPTALKQFAQRVGTAKTRLYTLLDPLRRTGARIWGVGCPSRAVTLINHMGLDDSLIECICEIRGSRKIGHYVPGTMIPIIDESELFVSQPEYAILFSWHLAEELINKLKDKGYKGKFIVPLPTATTLQ